MRPSSAGVVEGMVWVGKQCEQKMESDSNFSEQKMESDPNFSSNAFAQ